MHTCRCIYSESTKTEILCVQWQKSSVRKISPWCLNYYISIRFMDGTSPGINGSVLLTDIAITPCYSAWVIYLLVCNSLFEFKYLMWIKISIPFHYTIQVPRYYRSANLIQTSIKGAALVQGCFPCFSTVLFTSSFFSLNLPY